MKQHLRTSGLLGVAGVLVALVSGPAPAFAATSVSQCPAAVLSQPFSGDSRWYTLAPGETSDSFTGAGWVLTGGARITMQPFADGTSGPVLDLPAGSSATSPAMCVDGSYPLARMKTRTLGKAPDNSTTFYTMPVGSSTRTGGMPVLGTPRWAVSPPDNVAGGSAAAEQVQFRFVAGKKAADLLVYDLYIDPHMRY